VAGLAWTSGRLLAGRIGAPDMPPVDSGLPRRDDVEVDGVAAAAAAALVVFRSRCDMADPGRGGTLRAASDACFWAIIVSRSEGLPVPMVLFDKPSPGLAVGSALAALGLPGSFLSSFCA
jgi:hypothetical protein